MTSVYRLLAVALLAYGQFISRVIITGANVVVTITSPSSSATYDAGTSATVTVSGIAVSDSRITGCTWTNSLGGSGTATGTTTWTISGLALTDGANVVTVACAAEGGASGVDVITITRDAEESEATNVGAGLARGCTTAYYIDWDCDGYGPGVQSDNAYPITGLSAAITSGDMPDADDTDPFINTPDTVLANYDADSNGALSSAELKTFLSERRGYTVDQIFYVSTTGNNSTGTSDDPNLPYATYNGALYSAHGPGDAIIYRAGSYDEPEIGSSGFPVMKSGTSGAPIIIMSYPGELVKLRTTDNVTLSTATVSGGPGAEWTIADGFVIENIGTPGLGTAFKCSGAQNSIWRNLEVSKFKYPNCVNGTANFTLERSIFHHQAEHGLYHGAYDYFSTGDIVQDNIFYANGWDPSDGDLGESYGGMQFNGSCVGCSFTRNIIHSNSGWGMSLLMGVRESTISNNLIFNNGGEGIKIGQYPGDCGLTGEGTPGTGAICPYRSDGNLIINNTIWVGTTRADGNYGSGTYPEPVRGIFIYRDGNVGCVSDAGVSVAPVNCPMDQTIRNNIVYVRNGPGIQFNRSLSFDAAWESNSTYQNNLIYKTGGSNFFCLENYTDGSNYCNGAAGELVYNFATFNSTLGGGANLNSDPLFIRATSSEYASPTLFNLRFQSGSPARNAALATGVPTLDVAHTTRVATHEIGAYEYIGDPIVTWTAITPSGGTAIQPQAYTAQTDVVYDPYSDRMLIYAGRSTSAIIYSTDWFALDTTAQSFTHLGGTGSPVMDADYDGSRSSLQPWPGDRHPDLRTKIDIRRRILWMVGGYSSTCVGCQDYNASAYSGTGNGTQQFRDTWRYALHATPTSNTWTMDCGGINGSGEMIACANASSSPFVSDFPVQAGGATVYDHVTDALFLMGPMNGGPWKTWIWCPIPVTGGGLTASQTTAGCTSQERWIDITASAAGAPLQPNVGGTFQLAYPILFYDSYLASILIIPGSEYGFQNAVKYRVATKTYTTLNPSGLLTEPTGDTNETHTVKLTSGLWAGNYIYVQTSHTSTSSAHATYLYDVKANQLRALSVVGTGPQRRVYVGWDHADQTLVTRSYPGNLIYGTLGRQN